MKAMALLALALVACGSAAEPPALRVGFDCAGLAKPDAYTIEIDPALDAGQRAAVVDAIGGWVAAAPELRASIVFTSCTTIADSAEAVSDSTICVRAGSVADVSRCAGIHRTGCTHAHDVAILTDFFTAGIVGHELGHALGLVHTEAGTLMFPDDIAAGARPTVEDVAQYEALRGRSCR